VKFEAEVNEAIERLTEKMSGDSAELKSLFQRMQEGELSEVEAMAALVTLMGENPELAEQLQEWALEAFAGLRAPNLPAKTSRTTEILAADPNIMVPSVGLPKMNPLFEAALAERVLLDGDALEFRIGKMPEAGTPAVPVATQARSPIAIGTMLQNASNQVARELGQTVLFGLNEAPEIEQKDPGDMEAVVLSETGDTPELPDSLRPKGDPYSMALNAVMDAEDARVMKLLTPGPKGYELLQVAALREAETPSGSALATLSDADRQVAVWKTISTTQGRRSALGVIAGLVAKDLGIEVVTNHSPKATPEKRVVYAEWTVDINDPGGAQTEFAVVDTAAKALVYKLRSQVDGNIALEAIALNTIADRRVGWAIRSVETP